jgi:uncharacterized protein YbjT (DUF2867 family)
MYAIAGVSGHTGSVAAETLLAQGKQIRVIVRDAAKGEAWKAKGAEVAIASLDDSAALAKAFAGAEGAYVLLPPAPTSTDPVGHNARTTAAIAQAVKTANLPHVVLLSSVGAQHAEGTGPIKTLATAERELAATGAAFTAVRAAYFQENWGGSLGTLESGTIYAFVPNELRYPQVSTTDVGRTVAAALVEGGKRGEKRVIELAGPEDYDGSAVAKALSAVTGKTIQVQAAPLDAVVPTFTGFGLSKEFSELYREMYAGLISGLVAFEGRPVRGSVGVEKTLAKLLGR